MAADTDETREMDVNFDAKVIDAGSQRILQFVENIPGDSGSLAVENDSTKHDFFAKGRDLESAFINHKYTEAEKKVLGHYESLDYLPPHSKAYRDWIAKQPSRIMGSILQKAICANVANWLWKIVILSVLLLSLIIAFLFSKLDWDYWVMMGLIGFLVGTLGFLLHQFIDIFAEIKWERARKFIENENIFFAWLWVLAISTLFVLISSSSVVILRPSAGGSGLPEIIAYLNGTIVRHIFNVKTLGVKFLSCVFAVASGMPVGPEGPMVHLGSLIGAGCSQLKSSTLGIKLPFFKRFRNSEDRRNFISAGAAAGVASAFGSPVGGLLFSMEEVSSFWNMKLSWQTFFCCMVSTFTTDLLNSAFTAFYYQGNFGLFKTEKYILFEVVKRIDLNILAVIPAVLVGALGGMLGAVFTFLNLKIARARRKVLSSIKSTYLQKTAQISEPLLIMVVMGTVSVFLPALFPCTTFFCSLASKKSECNTSNQILVEHNVEHYSCPHRENITTVRSGYNISYNEAATLLFLTGEKAIHHLFSRETHLEFNFISLFVILPIYFVLACWAAGTAISSGVVIPKMFIGGLVGRIVGRVMVEAFGIHSDQYWAWMDPGAFALIGAAAFFGGVSRLTMSLTVIMVELTNDVQFLLLIMIAIMVSKWVGDYVTHPFYHAQLELKCIPFLDSEPVILYDGKRNLNLELFEVCHIMSSPVLTLETVIAVDALAKLLLESKHCGFPVVKSSHGVETFCGLITRTELSVLLCHEDIFNSDGTVPVLGVDYDQFCDDDVEKLSRSPSFLNLLTKLASEEYSQKYINLVPYANRSAVCVNKSFSLHRAYIIFRSLGLRHLVVIDERNQVVGIITRKDLMGYSMEEKLLAHVNQSYEHEIEEMQPVAQ